MICRAGIDSLVGEGRDPDKRRRGSADFSGAGDSSGDSMLEDRHSST